MTTKRTPGLMHQGLVRKGYVLPSGEGRVEAILVPGSGCPSQAEAEANARHLVAAWNALDGLTAEEAQRMAPGSVKLLLEACRQADAALVHTANGFHTGSEMSPRCSLCKVREATRAALAAAEGRTA